MSRPFRSSLALLSALTAATMITACGGASGSDSAQSGKSSTGSGSWQSVVDQANKEGQVVLYSTRSDADNTELLNGFMKKYPGIHAQAVRLVGGALVSKVDQELQAGQPQADVLIHSERQWSDEKAKDGALVEPSGPALSIWSGADQYYKNGVVVASAEPWVMAYNTNLVKSRPQDWDSLLNDSSYKGKVGLNEVSGLTVGIWYQFVEDKKSGYFEKLAALKPKIYPNSAPLTQALGSGELAWAPYSLPSTVEPLKAQGAPIDWVVPDSGTWALERDAMALKKAPHQAAAKVLLDFIMSNEGQTLLNGKNRGFSYAPGADVPDQLKVDKSKVAVLDYSKYPDSLTQKWQQKVGQLYH